MSESKKTIKKQVLPVLALRGLTVFPYVTTSLYVGREKSQKAIEEAMVNNQLIFLVAQKDEKVNFPEGKDMYNVGTICRIKQMVKLPEDTIRVLVEGITRAELQEMIQTEPYFMAEVVEKIYTYDDNDSNEMIALVRKAQTAFDEYAKISGRIPPEAVPIILSTEEPGQLADVIAANAFLKVEHKQQILDEFNPKVRIEKLIELLYREIEILELEKKINISVRKQMDKAQREYYLREQIKAIQQELGDKDGILAEVDEYRQKLSNAKFPKEVENKVLKELDRLLKTPQASAESAVIRTYIDWIFDLPWNTKTEEKIDLDKAKEILDEEHYGLEKVKERIIEYLAVRKLNNKLKGPILCLVGPPGVGKTSIAKSIAKALNRNYVRMSLGGVRDEAEIRGHRRTYVGAMPGRIIAALKQAGSSNPLILLDEIDKMSSDFRGDPSAAMLEVLDGEQNFSFRDHYLELPFDLSDVLFLTTANNLDTIPRPLLDRMEVINISGYTSEEKFNIAVKHLIRKETEAHGLKKRNLIIDDSAVRTIINNYTRESGVRKLEREIAAICRKAAMEIASGRKKSVRVTEKNIEKFLGTKKYRYDKANEKDEIGIATGLAWTPVGGETLSIEVNIMDGSGKLELTGQLGDVMKESARAAMSFIRSKAEQFGIEKDFYKKYDIHIHIPEGAIPKDGPSAGITLATAMISALSQIPVKRNVAMTGEITLRGRVLPIGGLKEKVLAAHRAGIDTIIIPSENKKDLDEIPEVIRKDIKFVMASEMDTVLETALAAKLMPVAGIVKHSKNMVVSDNKNPVIEEINQPEQVIEQ